MKNFINISILLLLLFSCNNKVETTSSKTIKAVALPENHEINYIFRIPPPLDSAKLTKYDINSLPKGNYNQLKFSIKIKQQELQNRYNKANNSTKKEIEKEAQKYIYETLLNKIIPHWYGMSWDMAGYSIIPQDGYVGCSYFISNTLLHTGFKLNRYRIAQAYSKAIARSMQASGDLVVLEGKSRQELIQFMKKNYSEGLFIIGLDSHVGYLLYRKDEVFIIHSSYYVDAKIVIEKAKFSPALDSNIFVIGELTTNTETIKKWLNHSRFPVIETN